jgi:hypothetical protein
MPSSWLWRRVGFVRADASEESVACIVRVERIRDLVTTLVVCRRIALCPTDFRKWSNVGSM